jgi:hypothetical protein
MSAPAQARKRMVRRMAMRANGGKREDQGRPLLILPLANASYSSVRKLRMSIEGSRACPEIQCRRLVNRGDVCRKEGSKEAITLTDG